jgi:hypothetical protein
VKAAVERICKPDMLQKLYGVHEHLDWIQGTSPNETWHSWLRRYIPVSGGIRTYQSLWVGLSMGVDKYNRTKNANAQARRTGAGQQSLAHARQAGARARVAAVDAALADVINGALDAQAAARRRHALRKAWHPHMMAQYDLGTLREMGFRPAKPFVGEVLSKEQLERLYQGFLRLLNEEEFVHTQDYYYYVQHHIAERELTQWQVDKLFSYIENKLNTRPQ